jgi:hypothetical protein
VDSIFYTDMDLEKTIKAQIKEASKSLTLDNHSIKVNNHGGRILLDRTLTGGFDFIFSEGKFIDFGAILGVYNTAAKLDTRILLK